MEQGDVEAFRKLLDDKFINHTTPIGADSGPNGMINIFNNILRPAMPDLTVTIYE